MSYDQYYEVYEKEIIENEIESLRNEINNNKTCLILFQRKIEKYENEKYDTLQMKKTYVDEVNKIRKLEERLENQLINKICKEKK